jgi:hypothetical protein
MKEKTTRSRRKAQRNMRSRRRPARPQSHLIATSLTSSALFLRLAIRQEAVFGETSK